MIEIFQGLWDWNGDYHEPTPGVCWQEWFRFMEHDYDEVDALYLDYDVCGGE